MNKLEELEKKYKEIGKEIEKLKNEEKLKYERKWTPKNDEEYCIVNDCGKVVRSCWNNDEIDNYRINFMKIFKTKAEAEEYLEFIKAKKECSYEFTQEECENNNIIEYSYYYHCRDKKIRIDYTRNSIDEGQTYFKTEEDINNFIEKYEKQILKYDYNESEEKNNE